MTEKDVPTLDAWMRRLDARHERDEILKVQPVRPTYADDGRLLYGKRDEPPNFPELPPAPEPEPATAKKENLREGNSPVTMRALLKATEFLQGYIGELISAHNELAQEVAALKTLNAEHEREIVELKSRGWKEVWQEGKTYTPGQEVTLEGARWFCHAQTTAKPGTSREHWQMTTKSR